MTNKAFKNVSECAFGIVFKHAISKDQSSCILAVTLITVRCCQGCAFADFNMTANNISFPTVWLIHI